MKVPAQRYVGDGRGHRAGRLRDGLRRADADGVGEGQLIQRPLGQPLGEGGDRVGLHRSVERAAERDRDGGGDPQPGRARLGRDSGPLPDQAGHRRALVSRAEAVRDRHDDVDLVDPGGQGAVQAAFVQHQPDVTDAVLARRPCDYRRQHRRHHRLGVRHLRDQGWPRERHGLYPPRARRDAALEKFDLARGGQDPRLVLQAIARRDLDKLDQWTRRCAHEVRPSRSRCPGRRRAVRRCARRAPGRASEPGRVCAIAAVRRCASAASRAWDVPR
jgi:hypothetical protein